MTIESNLPIIILLFTSSVRVIALFRMHNRFVDRIADTLCIVLLSIDDQGCDRPRCHSDGKVRPLVSLSNRRLLFNESNGFFSARERWDGLRAVVKLMMKKEVVVYSGRE